MLWSRPLRAALVGALAAAPAPALAQDNGGFVVAREPNEFERRSSGSLSFIQTRPAGAFQQNVGLGYGANLSYQFRLDDAGFLSLRADGVLSIYGGEHFYAPLSPTVGGRIQVKVSTNNHVMPLSIGPQLTWPRGRVRPYVNAGVGAQLLFTESSIEGTDEEWEFASTTNQSDWTSTWTTGAGIYVPVYSGKSTVLLDLGVQYYNGGRAQYLRPGSIEDLPNSQIRINALESDTHMYVVRLGVRIGR